MHIEFSESMRNFDFLYTELIVYSLSDLYFTNIACS